jgi:crotonobetainyl-CoA:carnitine CoA-transferase CaiB-like acyl-CoA transferase
MGSNRCKAVARSFHTDRDRGGDECAAPEAVRGGVAATGPCSDKRFATNVARSANRVELLPELHREFARRTRAVLVEGMTAAGTPCGEVLGLHDALTSRRAQEAGLVTEQAHPVAGSAHVVAPPYRLDGERLPVRRPPPQLGADGASTRNELLGREGYG